MKRAIQVLAILLALTCILAACAKAPVTPDDSSQASSTPEASLPGAAETPAANNQAKSDETLTVVIGGEPGGLLPSRTSGTNSSYIYSALCDRLSMLDTETGEVVPMLLESWEFVDDTHLRGILRRGITAYDGTELTAHDIMFTLELMAEQYPNTFAYYIDETATVVEDDYTIVFALKSPAPGLMTILAGQTFPIIDQSSFEACGGAEGANRQPLMGTGRYKFVEWVDGQYILLERNENYWDPDYCGYYKYIKFTFVSDAATRSMAVQSGDADVAADMNLGQISDLLENEKVEVVNLTGVGINAVMLNCGNDGPLSDIRVRQAIRYAIDPDVLNQVMTAGYGTRIDTFANPSSPYYSDPTGGAGFAGQDVEKAKALLAEAGYANGLELYGLSMNANAEVMTALQGMLAQVNINMSVNTPDTAVVIQMSEAGDYDIMIHSHDSWISGRTYNAIWQIDPDAAVLGGPKFKDADFAELVDLFAETLDEDKAKTAAAEIEQYLYDECAYVNISSQVSSYLVKKGISGAHLFPSSSIVDVTDLYMAG